MNDHRRCQETLAKLQTFLDRELSKDEVGIVRFHLEKCPPCEHLFRFEDRLRRLVKIRACTENAPPSLREQILARVRTSDRNRATGRLG
jgi:mycothiol system anti-sigma-R factor